MKLTIKQDRSTRTDAVIRAVLCVNSGSLGFLRNAMIYGLYLSAMGADAQAMRQAVIANNMANAGTTSFKRDIPVFRAHAPFDTLHQNHSITPDTIDEQSGGVSIDGTVTDFAQGPLKTTGRGLDLAIVGQGFLQVNANGRNMLTRDGRLSLDDQGQLITSDGGHSVLDDTGVPIAIPPEAASVGFGPEGAVYAVSPTGQQTLIAQLGLAMPDSLNSLVKDGENLYSTTESVSPAIGTRVLQGTIEESATEPVLETVQLIETARVFEMNMNMIKIQDEMLDRLLQAVPRK